MDFLDLTFHVIHIQNQMRWPSREWGVLQIMLVLAATLLHFVD